MNHLPPPFADYTPAPTPQRETIAAALASLPDPSPGTIQFITCNGELVYSPDHAQESLPAGLNIMTAAEFASLGERMAESPSENYPHQVLSTPFAHLPLIHPDEGTTAFEQLNRAHPDNALVILADGKFEHRPVEIIHIAAGDKVSIFPRTIVLAMEHSHVFLIERHVSASPYANQLVIGVQDIRAEESACVNYALMQYLGATSHAVELTSIALAKDATCHHLTSHQGAQIVRQDTLAHLHGAGASAHLLSANHLADSQRLDQHTYQHHAAPHTRSTLLYKNVLDDSARTSFSGMIRVEESATHADANQRNLNLLLSPNTRTDSTPGLEILTDAGVQCSHGAATAPIEAEQVFYLTSRGITPRAARALIAQGFLTHALADFPQADLLGI